MTLAEIRKRFLKITVREAAKRVGVHEASYREWEKGRATPSWDNYQKLLDLCAPRVPEDIILVRKSHKPLETLSDEVPPGSPPWRPKGVHTLRELRKAKGLTMQQLCDILQFPLSSYQYWETKGTVCKRNIDGTVYADPGPWDKIVEFFGEEPWDLVWTGLRKGQQSYHMSHEDNDFEDWVQEQYWNGNRHALVEYAAIYPKVLHALERLDHDYNFRMEIQPHFAEQNPNDYTEETPEGYVRRKVGKDPWLEMQEENASQGLTEDERAILDMLNSL